jgi:prolyl-tRNA synthetase
VLACVAEQHRDEHGLIWPVTIAPYQVHLVLLRGKKASQVEETADKLDEDLQAVGVEMLYDDRDESPGVKFNDADLIGLPIRLTVSERALAQGGVEMKLRSKTEKVIIPLDETTARIRSELATLETAITAKVTSVQYNG